MDGEPDRIPATTAGERAYRWTREAILAAGFPEGSFLEEKRSATRPGVADSRS